ncbi:MAG: hypothetical protein ACTSPG_02535 [Candidatus Hodarchaeales archaeon]
MSELPALINKSSLEGLAIKETEKFFKPRTSLDVVYTICLIFWWLFAFDVVLHSSFFFVLLVILLVTPVYMSVFSKEKSATSSMNKAAKLLIFYIIIQVTFPTKFSFPLFEDTFLISYDDFERLVVVLAIPVVILLNGFSIRSLDFGYFSYLRNILKGVWGSLLVIYIFKNIYLLDFPAINSLDFDLVLLIALISYILSSLLPVSGEINTVSLITLFEQYEVLQHPIERIRDHLFTGSLTTFLFLILNWINGNNRPFFSYLAVLAIIIGFILMFTPKKDNKMKNAISTLSKDNSYLKGNLGKKIENFSTAIKSIEFQEPKKVYSVSEKEVSLADKGGTNIVIEEGSIALPTVTDKGTALVVMGKAKLESEKESKKLKAKEIDGTTTIWLKPEEWNKVKTQFKVRDIVEISEDQLAQIGIQSKNELISKSRNAIEKMKSWKGPQSIFDSVLSPKPSKYSIQETKDYTLVKLPGINVFESKKLELVNLFGGMIKVIEMKDGGSYFQLFGGMITVIENKDYSFVQTPFVSVIETPKGELVRLFGIDIREGEGLDLMEFRERISLDFQKFNALFESKVEQLFESDPLLLLAESEEGEIGLLLSENESITEETGKVGDKGQVEENHVDMRERSALNKAKDEIEDIEREIQHIDESIYLTDEKFLKDEISESKHTEIVKRLHERKEKLLKMKDETKS